MFWLILILLFFGIFLMMIEVYAPHGISMIAGLGVIAYSCYLCYSEPGVSTQLATVYMVGALTVATGAAFFILRTGMKLLVFKVRKPDKGRLPDGQPAAGQPGLGQLVEVIQPLHPTGTVFWEGNRLPARTLRPEIESPVGEKVIVRGRDSIYTLVEPVEKSV